MRPGSLTALSLTSAMALRVALAASHSAAERVVLLLGMWGLMTGVRWWPPAPSSIKAPFSPCNQHVTPGVMLQLHVNALI